MKKIISVVYFHLFTLSRSSKYVMPLSFLIFLQMLLYLAIQNRPVDFLANLFLAEIFVFGIAVWL